MINPSLSDNASDIELIELALIGEQYAFTEIVHRHKSRIASTIHGMIGCCDEADDIGQEVFIRFFRKMEAFRGESALSTYLTRIAINLSLNEIKKRKRKKIFSLSQMIEERKDFVDHSSFETSYDNIEIVRMAVQKLVPKHRIVIVLRLIEGYSSEETAKILNLPVGTVLSRLARAQKILKEFIKPNS